MSNYLSILQAKCFKDLGNDVLSLDGSVQVKFLHMIVTIVSVVMKAVYENKAKQAKETKPENEPTLSRNLYM